MPEGPQKHRRRGLVRRRALLDAAVEVVAEKGFAGATHRSIAKRAGVPLATTSYYFQSIDDLVEEALRTFVSEESEELRGLIDVIGEHVLSADEAGALFADELVATSGKLALAQLSAYLEGARNPRMREVVAASIATYEEVARAALRAVGARDAEGSARAFVAMLDGFALHRLSRGKRPEDSGDVREALRMLFVSCVMTPTDRKRWNQRLRRKAPRRRKPAG